MPEPNPNSSIITPDAWSPLHRLCGDELSTQLARFGVARVFIQFDGGAARGVIESIRSVSTGGKSMVGAEEVLLGDISLYQAIEESVLNDLNAKHPGWEQGDGSFGTYKLDVESGAVSVEFVGRPVDKEDG